MGARTILPFRIDEMRVLYSSQIVKIKVTVAKVNQLFRMICRVCEYSWIKSTSDSIMTLNQYAVLIGL